MAEQLPVWNNPGIEPSTDLKVNGWQPGQKPSAQHFNWLFNRAYKCLEELQGDSAKITELEQTLTELEQTVTSNDTKVNEHLTETASKFTNINLNIIDMAVELETLKGATLNGVTANIFVETFTNLNDINLMNGVYDSVNKRLVL